MVKKIKTIAIIQARLTSKRFPSKVLKKIGRLTSIQLINERLKLSKYLNDIVFSIPNNIQNKKLESHLIENKIKYYKGSENNVVSRFLNTAKKFKADNIVRVTADCPLVDPKMLDQMLHNFKKNKVDYLTNSKDPLIQNDKYSYPKQCLFPIYSEFSIIFIFVAGFNHCFSIRFFIDVRIIGYSFITSPLSRCHLYQFRDFQRNV